jgi:hypothetical protein
VAYLFLVECQCACARACVLGKNKVSALKVNKQTSQEELVEELMVEKVCRRIRC